MTGEEAPIDSPERRWASNTPQIFSKATIAGTDIQVLSIALKAGF